jgi:tRNA dimethylallyltransferase
LVIGADMAVHTPLLVILGPTASGKSDLAMEVARRTNAEILSVDSMQVYRGMDIGTAKPAPAEQAAVPHHLIDVIEPNQEFTVARFVELADAVIRRTDAAPLIATGGTPLYYKALFEGLFEGPPADDRIRDRLRQEPGEILHARLKQVDPVAAVRIHANDTRRVIRALEVYEITGRPITSFQTDWDTADAAANHRHHAVWIGLNWDKEVLNRRINARVKLMIAAGWLEETRELLKRFGDLSKTAAEATGYADLIAHIQGKISLDDAVEQIKISTRQLARKQMKWFRRWPQVKWLAGDAELSECVEQTLQLWNAARADRQA